MNRTDDSTTSSDFYCPVCGNTIDRIWVWMQAETGRARIFCETCASRPEYASLPADERRLMEEQRFNQWAGERILSEVYEKEHPEK